MRTKTFSLRHDVPDASSDLTPRDNWIMNFVIIAVIVGIMIVYFSGSLTSIPYYGWIALSISMAAIAVRLIYFLWEQKSKGKYDNLLLMECVGISLALFFAFSVLYDSGFLAIFSPDWSVQMYVLILLEYAAVIVIMLPLAWKSIKERKLADIILPAIFMIVPGLMLLLFWIIPTNFSGQILYWCSVVIMVALILLLLKKETPENRLKIGTIYAACAAVSFTVIALMTGIFTNASLQAILVGGDVVPVNYFSLLWQILFSSPASAIMISIMAFGATVNIFTMALEGNAVVKGLGLLIQVFPPMLIILSMWTSNIPPPDIFVDLFGAGMAAPVFGTLELGVFGIMMTILGFFTGWMERRKD